MSIKTDNKLLASYREFCWLGWASIVLFHTYHHHQLLGANEPAGADLLPHFYLMTSLAEALRQGALFFYDTKWLGGYPAFSVYPPLMYLPLALASIALRSTGFELLFFNLFLFALPLALVWIAQRAARIGLSPAVSDFVPFIAFLYLFSDTHHAYSAIGLSGLYQVGFLNNFVAQILFFVLLGILLRVEGSTPRAREILMAGLTLGAILATHVMTAVFSVYTLVVWTALHLRRRVLLLVGTVSIAVMTASWWLLELASSFSIASAAPIGGPTDPLFILFSRFDVQTLTNLFTISPQVPSLYSGGGWIDSWVYLISAIPYAGAATFVFVLMGLQSLIRQRRFVLPVSYLLGVLVLPRDWLHIPQGPGLHLFRLTQGLWLLQILIGAAGLLAVCTYIQKFTPTLKRTSILALSTVLACAVCSQGLLNYGFERRRVGPILNDTLLVSEAAGFRDLEKAIKFLTSVPNTVGLNRVATEVTPEGFRTFGTPHYLSYALPSELPTLTSFMPESSCQSPFVNALLHVRSNHLVWGWAPLTQNETFMSMSMTDALSRLQQFGVRFVVATSPQYRSRLERTEIAALRLSAPSLAVFELPDPAAAVVYPKFRPWAYLYTGGPKFRDIASLWFVDKQLDDIPLLELSLSDLQSDQALRRHLGGIVLAADEHAVVSDSLLHLLQQFSVPIILLNGKLAEGSTRTNLYQPTGMVRNDSDSFRLTPLIARLSTPLSSTAQDRVTSELKQSFNLMEIGGDGPRLVNFGYAPRWKASTGAVYRATPCRMLVTAEGPVTLRYQ